MLDLLPSSAQRPESIKATEPALLGLFTDYEALCAPYLPSVRDVLEGKTLRAKLKFNDAVFVFHHGCLMSQVLHQGVIRALPPFGLDDAGKPYLQALPEHQQHWLGEFLQLPKSVLMFYFTLVKGVFAGEPLRCRWEDPETGHITWRSVPDELQPILQAVGW
jgi:hypothetical protein